MTDIPKRYKAIIDIQTINIMQEAEKLWPFVRELGHSYECDSQDIRVVIKSKIVEDQIDTFERWLKSSCFHSPTKGAYDMAKAAWLEANKNI